MGPREVCTRHDLHVGVIAHTVLLANKSGLYPPCRSYPPLIQGTLMVLCFGIQSCTVKCAAEARMFMLATSSEVFTSTLLDPRGCSHEPALQWHCSPVCMRQVALTVKACVRKES